MIKIKNSFNLISVILCGIICFLISYFVLQSIPLSLIIAVISSVFITLINKQKKNAEIKRKQYKDICEFINMMNAKMLETYDVFEAYSNIENYLPIEFSNMSINDFYPQLDEIALNYNSEGFKMFVNDLKIYKDNDVNYHLLIDSSTKLCLNGKNEYELLSKKKCVYLTQINYLYVLWITLLVFIKMFVTDYYVLMMSSFIYQLLMFCVLLLGLVLYYFAYKEYLK